MESEGRGHGILFSFTKKGDLVIFDSMDEPGRLCSIRYTQRDKYHMTLLLHGNLKHQTPRSEEQKVLFYRDGRYSWYRRNWREISQRTQKTIRKVSKNCQSQDPNLPWQAVLTWEHLVLSASEHCLAKFSLRLLWQPLSPSHAPQSNSLGRKPWGEHFKAVIKMQEYSSPQLMASGGDGSGREGLSFL